MLENPQIYVGAAGAGGPSATAPGCRVLDQRIWGVMALVVTAACGANEMDAIPPGGSGGSSASGNDASAGSGGVSGGGGASGSGGVGGVSGSGGAGATGGASGSGGSGGSDAGLVDASNDAASPGLESVYFTKDHLTSVAVDDTMVFAGGDLGVIAVAKTGGSATTLSTAQVVVGIAADATHVYAASAKGKVLRLPKTGGGEQVLFTSSFKPRSVALDGATLWFTETHVGGGGCLYRVPADGSAAATAVDCTLCDPSSLAIGGGYAWVANFNCIDGPLVRIPLAGGPQEVVATDSPLGVAVGGANVFWTHHSGNLSSQPLTGGPTVATAQSYDFAQGVVADASGVFVTHEGVTGTTGRLVHWSPGAEVTLLAQGFALPEIGFINIAVDATHVYFAGALMPFSGSDVLRAPRQP